MLIALGTSLRLLLLILTLLRVDEPRRVRAPPREVGRVKRVEIRDARKLILAKNLRGDLPRIDDRRLRIEDPREALIGHAGVAARGERLLHAFHGEPVVGAALGMLHPRSRGGEHALQVIRHELLDPIIDAQVLAQVENELEAQPVVAVAREKRRP